MLHPTFSSVYAVFIFRWTKVLTFFWIVSALGAHATIFYSDPFFIFIYCSCMQSKLPFNIHASRKCFEANWINKQIVSPKELWHCIDAHWIYICVCVCLCAAFLGFNLQVQFENFLTKLSAFLPRPLDSGRFVTSSIHNFNLFSLNTFITIYFYFHALCACVCFIHSFVCLFAASSFRCRFCQQNSFQLVGN